MIIDTIAMVALAFLTTVSNAEAPVEDQTCKYATSEKFIKGSDGYEVLEIYSKKINEDIFNEVAALMVYSKDIEVDTIVFHQHDDGNTTTVSFHKDFCALAWTFVPKNLVLTIIKNMDGI